MAVLLAAALLPVLPVSFAADWPMWGRTNARNMVSPERGLPERFDPGQPKANADDVDLATTKNVKWVARLGSQTYGNVVVAQGRVLIGTNNDPPRDPRFPGDRSLLLCLDEQTGALQWQFTVPKLKEGRANDWESLGILSSPVVSGKNVYLVTSRGEVVCLDLNGMADGNDGPFQDEAHYVVQDLVLDRGQPTERPAPPIPPGPHDADIVWVYHLMDELGVFPHNAANSSPLILDGRVYVGTGNGTDWTGANVPSPFSPSFIALDGRTGALAGEDDAGIGPRVFLGQWSSVAAATVNGRPLLFGGGGDGVLYAFDATPTSAGDRSLLKKVWWFDCNPPEYKAKDGKPIPYGDANGPSEINATPVFYRNRVYVAIGQEPEHGEGVGRLVCVDATKTGDLTRDGLAWDFRGIHRSLSTVSIDPATGLLFTADFSGFVYCLDADSGKVCWTHDLKSHVWGSTLVADGKVYLGDEDGDVFVFAASREKKLLSQANLNGPVYSSPVVANGTLYLASATQLYAIHAGATQPAAGK
jgi:outer membrane protein assembly factor BamB